MTGNKGKFSFTARLMSFKYVLRGLLLVLKEEHNIRFHLIATIVVVIAGIIFQINRTDWIIVLLCIGFVLSAEIMNSAVEKLVDMVSLNRSDIAGIIKDIAAGAVLVSAIISLIAGLLVFLPHVSVAVKQLLH